MGFWNQFEGQLLDGQFKLSKYSGQDGPCAVFQSELTGQEKFVAVKIIRSASLPAQQLSNSWKIAKDLQHPNLVRVHATATADLEGLRVLYAVLDCPDASLADVIQQRRLNEEESREILVSGAEALHYLHQKALVHGNVRPASIVAIEDHTKLAVDSLSRLADQKKSPSELDRYDAPEVKQVGYSPASDIWAFGVTLFEALTQSVPTGNADSRLLALPAPFSDILQHCLDPRPVSRWSARQIFSYRQSGASAAASSPASTRPQTVPVPVGVPERIPPTAPDPEPTRLMAEPNIVARSAALVRKFVPLRYAVSAILIIFCISWLARTSQTGGPGNGTAGAAGFAVTTPSAPLPDPVPLKEKPAPMPPARRAAPLPSGTADRARSIWRVVVYTYSSSQSAQAKAREINAASPQLNARELTFPGEKAHLVVVGGNMSRTDASNLRARLLDQGFPKDVYIQNFSQ